MINKTKSFQNQIKQAFIIVVVIPVILLSLFFIYSSFKYINNKNLSEIHNLINQNSIDIKNKIKNCDNSLRYLAANYDLKNFLLVDNSNYLQLSQYSKNIKNLFYNIMIPNPYYEKLTLFTDKELNLLTEFIKNSEDVKKEDWYKNIVNSEQNYWWYENDKLFMGRKIISAYPLKVVGVIVIEIDKNLFYDSFNIFKDIPIKISVGNNKQIFYKYIDTKWTENPKLKRNINLNINNWKITYEIDKIYFKDYLLVSLFAPLFVIFLILLLTWVLISYLPKKLSKDLFGLVEEIEAIQKGDFNIKFSSSKIKEINILSEGIQNMLDKISKLIDEVYDKEIERQELEINLLQSKMKPHFLYNNLSAINWIALEFGQEKIYTIATELANFYRTSLNKGRNIDKISIELENIKSYINLQLISHNNSFNVEYDIDEIALNKDIPIFILQPLVENAIEHGIDQLYNKIGLIKIKIHQKNEYIEIYINDNGNSLYKKIGVSQLKKENFGYGISNISKRIQLLYGNSSFISIFCDEYGTTSLIKLKFNHLRKII